MGEASMELIAMVTTMSMFPHTVIKYIPKKNTKKILCASGFCESPSMKNSVRFCNIARHSKGTETVVTAMSIEPKETYKD